MRLVEDAPSSEEADETAPSTQVITSIQELSVGPTSSTTSSEDENEKFHRHTIHSDGKIQQKQQDFGTLSELKLQGHLRSCSGRILVFSIDES